MLYFAFAFGVIAIGVLVLLVARAAKRREKAEKKRGTSWRQSEYYNRFYAGLATDQKRRFLALSEAEQFKTYMDWSLKEGLRNIEHSGIQEQ